MIRKLWPYIIGSVALGLDAYVIAGLLPEIASDLHSSTSLIGLGVAAFTGAYAISGPLFAGAAGRRASQSLMLALGLFVVANLLTAASTSAPLFIITRLVAGAAAGIYSPLSSAVAAGTVGPERRGRALALVLAGLACGTVFGVPLGLLIAERVSWHLTFILIAGIGIAAMIGVGVRGHGQIANVEAPNFVQRLNTLRSARNLTTMLVTLLTGIASLGLYTYMIPMLEGMGHSSSQRWVIWVWGIGGALGAIFVGRIVDSAKSSLRVTAVITLALTASLVLLGTNVSLIVLGIATFLWGLLGWASLAPQQHTLMTANPSDGATAVAANASANYMGSALGSVLGAALINAQITGSHLAYLAAVPAGLAFLLQMVRVRMGARP